tara:strand:+ start:115 stop:594 length:480 start_codon:yes stop_codon:yes gene_type:complete
VSPRRPVREKKSENKEFRNLLLSLYNVSDLRILWKGPLSEELRESIFRAAQTDSFVAKRRYEREVVNKMRVEDEEGMGFLYDVLNNEELFLEQLEESLQGYRTGLLDHQKFSEFIEEHPHVNIQLLRQRLRNHAQKSTDKTKSQLDELLSPLIFPLDWT